MPLMSPRFSIDLSVSTVILVSIVLCMGACNDAAETGWGDRKGALDTLALTDFRRAKDSAMRGEGSPIPRAMRAGFTGLRYFPPNPDLVFDLELQRLARPESIDIQATGGDLRKARRLGYFRFSVNGAPCSLAAYELAESPGVLFVPFHDRTNGHESYEGGRYVDAQPDGGRYRLDFNYAYNPYCAYSHRWSSPVPPPENRLTVSVRAGEMKFHPDS